MSNHVQNLSTKYQFFKLTNNRCRMATHTENSPNNITQAMSTFKGKLYWLSTTLDLIRWMDWLINLHLKLQWRREMEKQLVLVNISKNNTESILTRNSQCYMWTEEMEKELIFLSNFVMRLRFQPTSPEMPSKWEKFRNTKFQVLNKEKTKFSSW